DDRIVPGEFVAMPIRDAANVLWREGSDRADGNAPVLVVSFVLKQHRGGKHHDSGGYTMTAPGTHLACQRRSYCRLMRRVLRWRTSSANIARPSDRTRILSSSRRTPPSMSVTSIGRTRTVTHVRSSTGIAGRLSFKIATQTVRSIARSSSCEGTV